MDFSRFEALTFDCYGTLIDWETGILGVMRGLAREADRKILGPATMVLGEVTAIHDISIGG